MDGQLERRVPFRIDQHAAMLPVAAVADNDILDEEVEDAVERGGPDQDRPGEPPVVEPVGDRRADERPQEDRHPERVGEILLAVEFVVAADGARRQGGVGHRGGDGDEVVAA